MKKLIRLKKIFIIFLVFIFLFPSINIHINCSLADTKTGSDELNAIGKPWKIAPFYEWKATNHSLIDEKRNQGSLKRNSKYGWFEYKEGKTTYVVLAGPTKQMYEQYSKNLPEDIHYFNLGDVLYFKFDPRESKDDNIYTGKILAEYYDSSLAGSSTLNSQYIFADLGIDEEDFYSASNNYTSFKDKQIIVSSTGTFPDTAEEETRGNFLLNALAEVFLFIGDTIEKLLTAEVQDTQIEKVDKIVYTKVDIRDSQELQQILELNLKSNSNTSKADTDENKKTGLYSFTVPSQFINQTGIYELLFDDYVEVPVIPSDLFVLARAKINICDIDFFNKSNENPNKFFGIVKYAVNVIGKIMLYVCIALVLTTLIFRSLMLVMASYTQNPEKAKRAKRKIDSLLKNIILIAFIYFIIIFIMYFYKTVTNYLSLGEDIYYPLRLTVPAGYSFNTNIVGAVRTLTLTTNGLYKMIYALFYCIIAIISILWFFAMLIRMLAIALCIIMAPFTVIYTYSAEGSGEAVEAKGVLYFSNWLKIYNILIWMPVLLVIIERIVVLLFN